MSAESRVLSPDWHRYRIAWRIQESNVPACIGLSANGPVEQGTSPDSKVMLLYAHPRSE